MNIDDRFREIRCFCEANANAAVVEKYRKYFVEGYDAYGMTTEILRRQRDHWLHEWQAIGLEGFLDLGDRLVATGKYEEASFAILFMAAFKPSYSAGLLPKLGCWLEHGFRNWAHVDVFSGEVLSHFLTAKIAPLDTFAAWRSSESKWKRRAVPVTAITCIKADSLPVKRVLAFLDPMMKDEEKVVRQGLGWCLREAWKKEPDLVEGFLLGWKDACGRLIIQYATEKMTPAQRARFKAAKPKPRRTHAR